MPLNIDKVKIAGTKFDKRCKLTEDQRRAIRILSKEHYSHRKLAAMFGVSKSLVESIITPQKRSPAPKKSPEYWAEIKRRYRARKKELLNSGKIEKNGKTEKK